MMPWAGFFIITRSALFLARWEGRESRLQSVLRRAAVLPILPGGPFFVLHPWWVRYSQRRTNR